MHIKINVIIIIMQLINSWIISRNGTFTAVRIMIELLVCWHKRILYSLQQPDHFTQPL